MSKRLFQRISNLPFFIKIEENAGILLLFCTIFSVLFSNSPFQEGFMQLIHFHFALGDLHLSLAHIINDGLMAFFFLLVGLEIKRELVSGELSSIKQSLLPVLAAIGGMTVPALFYFFWNQGLPSISGWAVPTATDIAFSLAILSMVGKNVPLSLKIFLTALAVIDDLGAIIVIALFYSSDLSGIYFVYLALATLLLILMNYFKVKNTLWYLLIGVFVWYFTLKSGIHATIAGVIVALTIPLHITKFDKQLTPLDDLIHALHKPVNYLIMPLFAFFNTAIFIEMSAINLLPSGIGLGIMLGLFLGKPIGIVGACFISTRLGWTNLPKDCNWQHIIGTGFLAGIGFTMSIFISLLAFQNESDLNLAKIAILLASILSGLMGYLLLKKAIH